MKSAAQFFEEKNTKTRQSFSLRLPESTMNALVKLRDKLNSKQGSTRAISVNDLIELSVMNFLEKEGYKAS